MWQKNFPSVHENKQTISNKMKKFFQNFKSHIWDIIFWKKKLKGNWLYTCGMEVIHAIQHAGHRAYKREIRYSSCPGETLYGKKEEIWTTIIILVQTDVSLWAVNSIGESTIVKWKYACRYGEKLHNWNMLHRMQWSESHQKEINEETKQQNRKVSDWKTRMSSGNDCLNEQWRGNWEMKVRKQWDISPPWSHYPDPRNGLQQVWAALKTHRNRFSPYHLTSWPKDHEPTFSQSTGWIWCWVNAGHRLPWCFNSKEPACQCRKCWFSPWVRKITWRKEWQPTLVFLPG